ncbi:MAG: hypothetical protein IJZ68_08305 [Bacteroidaceae bacterium]|nr:hypothetical protein [Bacteroidaceae bacterium]
MEFLKNILMPQWCIGLIAAGGLWLWGTNMYQAVRNHDIKMSRRSAIGLVFEAFVLVCVIAYYIWR